MELQRRFKKNLKRLMGKQTQQVFARRIGIGQSSLHRILRGEQDVGLNLVETVAKHLGIDPFELLKADRQSASVPENHENDSGLGFLPWNHDDDSKTSESPESINLQSRDVNLQ